MAPYSTLETKRGEKLPRTYVCVRPESPEIEGEDLEFRLIYQGSLPAQQSDRGPTAVKHKIRQEFHKQLKELWQQNWMLRQYVHDTGIEHLTTQYQRNGYNFIPLVSENNAVVCNLEVLFLRRDNPGNFVIQGGDIDNRVKVLFDALRMPKRLNEIPHPPQQDEDPFYVLMEDDKFITGFTVTTDRLLLPEVDGSEKDVFIVIRVQTRVTNPRINESFQQSFWS